MSDFHLRLATEMGVVKRKMSSSFLFLGKKNSCEGQKFNSTEFRIKY